MIRSANSGWPEEAGRGLEAKANGGSPPEIRVNPCSTVKAPCTGTVAMLMSSTPGTSCGHPWREIRPDGPFDGKTFHIRLIWV
jgi:hypothetical protein